MPDMKLKAIYSFLTYPKKSQPDEPLKPGLKIQIQDDKLIRMIRGIFDNAENECNIPIKFVSHENQNNDVRNELADFAKKHSLLKATPLALRLQRATGGQSGMGLLFICIGDNGDHSRVVISRFPADQGVVADTSQENLSVKFEEQVFLKNAHSYKAATYIATGRPNHLWNGHVIDRQINGNKSVADYWITDFLKSEFATTKAAGTKRLAVALKEAAKSATDPKVRHEIASAAYLANNLPDQALTISAFCDQFNFSSETKQAVLAKVDPPRLVHDSFRFDATEFARHIAYRQIELDNGAILAAPADRFDSVFKETHEKKKHTFSTTGQIVDERLKVRK